MKEDYLWDRTGEPDPEIEKLEEALSKLRFRPVPLKLPAQAPRTRRFFPGLAAAAAILLVVLAGGLWLGQNRSLKEATTPLVIVDLTPGLTANLHPFHLDPDWLEMRAAERSSSNVTTDGALAARRVSRESRGRHTSMALVASRRIGRQMRQNDERVREGELAKEQLIMALHLASSNLNLVQKKIQVNKDAGPTS